MLTKEELAHAKRQIAAWVQWREWSATDESRALVVGAMRFDAEADAVMVCDGEAWHLAPPMAETEP